MKLYVKITVVVFYSLFVFSCSSKKEKKKEVVSETTEIETPQNKEEVPECIFDQKTQNDDFLKGKKELKGYTWDDKTKTATLKLSDTETIEIYRGGCDYFIHGAKFIVPKSISLDNDKDAIMKKKLWISELIFDKEGFELIKNNIENKKYTSESYIEGKTEILLEGSNEISGTVITFDTTNPEYNTYSITFSIS